MATSSNLLGSASGISTGAATETNGVITSTAQPSSVYVGGGSSAPPTIKSKMSPIIWLLIVIILGIIIYKMVV